jgi:hypothetical protein
VIAGVLLGVATAAAYMVGAGRSYGYDAAATFANFVATPSLWDAFAIHTAVPITPLKSIASNDHVLLSLLSHVSYSITGSRSEIVYRLVPALAAGGTVGVTTVYLAQRFGMVAGVSAGLFVATDLYLSQQPRSARASRPSSRERYWRRQARCRAIPRTLLPCPRRRRRSRGSMPLGERPVSSARTSTSWPPTRRTSRSCRGRTSSTNAMRSWW